MQPQAHNAGIAWKPGFSRHVPWIALVNILGFTVCCIALGIVLWKSDGKEISTWPDSSRPVSVSVLLSLGVSVANLCLVIALQSGYEIAWWLQALKGAELRKLKFDLDIQSTVLALVSRKAAFDKFAIAAVISLAVSLADGPLIQKASTAVTKTFHPTDTDISLHVSNASLPADFSGYGAGPDLLTPLFGNISRAYSNRDDIALPIDGCVEDMTCALTLPAPGFDVSCTEKPVSYDFHKLAAGTRLNNVTTFKVDVGFGGTETFEAFSTVNVTALYKPDASCTGQMIQRNCMLRLAMVRYPVTVSNGTAKLKSWELGQNDTIEISSFPKPYPLYGYDEIFTGSYAAGGFMSMLGGIAFVLEDLYTASVALRLATTTLTPYVLIASGQAASNFLTSEISTYGNCTMTWEDPTTDLVNTARELMLRSTIAYSDYNSSAVVPQQLAVQRTKVAAAYRSHYKYLGITIAIMVLQVLIIFFLLQGWRHLGREVSLHAFDIARALGAPMLQSGGSNTNIDEALEPLQRIRLRYGEILPKASVFLVGDNKSQGEVRQSSQPASPDESVQFIEPKGGLEPSVKAEQRPRLGLDEQGRVGNIRSGILY
ncbi:Fc.00g115280.m01.CDS01 [Cosmosporella sp. VM-42]